MLSCEETEVLISKEEIQVDYVHVPDTVFVGIPFDLVLVVSLSGCWSYASFELDSEQSLTRCKVMIENSSDANFDVNCMTGFFRDTIYEKMKLHTKGNNRLLFNEGHLVKVVYVKSN